MFSSKGEEEADVPASPAATPVEPVLPDANQGGPDISPQPDLITPETEAATESGEPRPENSGREEAVKEKEAGEGEIDLNR